MHRYLSENPEYFDPAAPADMLFSSPNELGIRRPGSLGISYDETARVDRTSRWRGARMATRRACAATRPNAADRRADGPRRGRSGNKGPPRGIPAGARKAWMVRRPQCPHRLSLCAGRRSGAGVRERADRPATRRDLHTFDAGRRRCSGRAARSRSCSPPSPTQSAQALLRVWRDRAAISPA
jgi:hypothetical protein